MSTIQRFFKGKNVLITGASGFLGNVLQQTFREKIPDVSSVVCLYHSKPPTADSNTGKVEWIQSDLSRPDLGMNSDTLTRLRKNTNVVFHLAAYTRWDKGIKDQVLLNTVQGMDFVKWTSTFDRLDCLFMASSYWASLINRQRVGETPAYYRETVRQDFLARQEMKEILEQGGQARVHEWPNAYSYSKNLLERRLVEEYSHLPLVLGRITSVCGAWEFPKRGFSFFDNALPSLLRAVATEGCVHFPESVKTALNDCIPVDLCVNLMLANMVERAKKTQTTMKTIYLSSAHRNPYPIGKMLQRAGDLQYHPTSEAAMKHLASLPVSRSIKVNQMVLKHYAIGFEEKHVFLDDAARTPLEWMTKEDMALFPCRVEEADWSKILEGMVNELTKKE